MYMYNNFSSKKTKKVISALLASALVVTSGPITADAATAKVVGIKKSITVSASATNKVTGLSKAEKKVVKVTKKGKKFTIKGLKAGKATFKIGKKSYTVKVGATTVKAAKTKLTLTKGKKATLKFTTKSGNGDTLTFKASNKNVTLAKTSAKIAKSAASVKATAKKAGKTTITATSKATGKKATVTVTVKNPAKPATTTPGASNTPVATATGSATNTPEATATATATASGSATNTPDVTATPVATATGTATATPVATGSATNTPEATEVPTEAPTKAPEVVTGGTITVTGTAVSGATIVVTNASGAAVDTTKRLPAGTYTVSVSKDGYIAQSKEVTIADKDAKVVEINLEKMLEVSSIKALNLVEVEVTFSKALTYEQQTEAVKASNYEVYKDGDTAKTAVDKVTLADDNKSAILLLHTPMTNAKQANKVTVKKAVGMFADATVSNLESKDVEIPQIASVKAVGNKVIKITFTEAVQSKTSTTIENTSSYEIVLKGTTPSVAITSAELSDDMRTVTLTTTNPMAVGTYEVTVKKDTIKDFAGYDVLQATKEVAVSAASTVSQAKSVKVNSRQVVDVTFDNPVVAENGVNELKWETAAGSKTTTTVKSVNDTTLRFTFASGDIMPAGKVKLSVSKVKDAYNFQVPTKEFTDVEVKEETAATATVTVVNDGKLEVQFSKEMQGGSSTNSTTSGDASNKASYVITDAKGDTVDLSNFTIVAAPKTEDGKTTTKVTLTTTTPLSGAYTVTVKDVKDTLGLAMTTLAASVNVTDTTKPDFASANAVYGASSTSKKISVAFSEPMATSGDYSIGNKDNYVLVNSGVETDLPANTTIDVASDAKSVIITLPSDTEASVFTVGTTELQVGKVSNSSVKTVADAAGNIFKHLPGVGSGKQTIAAESTIQLGTTSTAVNETTIRVPMATGTLAKVDAADFLYTVDGITYKAVKSATLTTVDKKQYVDLELNDTLSAKTDRTKVLVKTIAANLKSETALGSPLSAKTSGIAAPVATLAAWPFRAAMKSAEILDDSTIRVTFDGRVSDTNLKDLLSATNNGVDKSISSVVEKNDDTVLVKFAAGTLNTTYKTIVKTKTYNSITTTWAVDKNGVIYAENTTGLEATYDGKLKVQDVKATLGSHDEGKIAADTDKVEITFNQKLDPASIKESWDGTSPLNVVVNFSADGTLSILDGAESDAADAKAINFGTIKGFTVPAATALTAVNTNVNATLGYDDENKKLTLTFKGSTVGAAYTNAVVNGTLTYSPSDKIKSAVNEAIDAKAVATKTFDAKAVVYEKPTIGTATVNTTYTFKFSEVLNETDKAAVEDALKVVGVLGTNVTLTWNGATLTAKTASTTSDAFTPVEIVSGGVKITLDGQENTVLVVKES